MGQYSTSVCTQNALSESSKTPNILLVAPYPVAPVTSGGKIRVFEMARLLARRDFNVTVLAPFKPGQRSHYDPSCGFELKQIPYPFLLPLALGDRPLPYGHWASYHPGLGVALRSYFARFDVVQFEQAYWGGLAAVTRADQVVTYDAHNVEFDYLTSEADSEWARRWTAARALYAEGVLCRRADLTVCCTQEDADRLAELYSIEPETMMLAPNGIQPLPELPEAGESAPPAELRSDWPRYRRWAIFSGSDVAHNRAAVEWILDTLAPSMEQRCGFIIHGGVSRSVPSDRTAQNVFLDPDWDAVGRYAGTGVVGLNPVTQGSGMNLKLLNYLAMGLPTVSTPFGMRGCRELEPLVTVRSLERFAEGVETAQAPGSRRTDLLKSYEWTTICDRTAQRLHALLAERRR